jgi:hypothetical protein
MSRDRGINFEMIVEFIIAAVLAVLFFLPGFGFLGKTVSCAGIFTLMRDMMQSSQYGWAAYTFLLLYLIPLFALICAICFISGKKRAVRGNFVSLCNITISLLVILILTGAYSASGFDNYGQSLLDTITGMGAPYWIMLALSVAGLIITGIARAMRKPVMYKADPPPPGIQS